MNEVLVDRARLQELEHVEKMWLNACKIGHMHLHMFVVPGESFFEHGIPRVAGELAKSWAELSRLYTEGVKMAQETTKLIEELNEAKAKAESAWQSEHCLRLSMQSERDAALGAVREIMKQRAEAEAEVARAETVRRLDERNMAREYRRGAEAMREACAQWVDHWVSGHVADKLRDMPIPEDV